MESSTSSCVFLLAGYTHLDRMAHRPKGSEGSGMYALDFDGNTKQLTLSSSWQCAPNPAFVLPHPTLNKVKFD